MASQFPISRAPLCDGCCEHRIIWPSQAGRITIQHPGYPENDSPLLMFRGHDSADGAIDFDLVHTCCAIIANNRFDGWLSRGREVEDDRLTGIHLLHPGRYYFHVTPLEDSQLGNKYPIVATFRAWTFPNSALPAAWSYRHRIEPNDARYHGRCIMSGQQYSLDKAHIIPDAEGDWFFKNNMVGFGQNWDLPGGSSVSRLFDDPGNIITLKTDLHRAWDDKLITFVPKRLREDGPYHIVTHYFGADEQFGQQFHNAPLHPSIETKPREYLLARLAWMLLPTAIRGFLLKGVPET